MSETWLISNEANSIKLQIEGFKLITNSVGRGKGLATYFREGIFRHITNVQESAYQITKIKSPFLDVISVYRSKEASSNHVAEMLLKMIENGRNTLITGDFNICFKSNRSNKLIKTLEEKGLKQFVNEATHIKGGTIDHIYSNVDESQVEVSLYSPYYCARDHDALLSIVKCMA